MKENKLHSQQEQIEKLEELGSRLRQCRTAQSLPIEEVAARTRIQARLLNAIEEGRLDQLPEPVYIKGFIKQFAEAVGLNGVEFSSTFPMGSSLPLLRSTWKHLPTAQLRPIHLYGVYILLVIGAVNGLSFLVRRSATPVAYLNDYPQQNQQLPAPNTLPAMNLQQKLGDNKASEVTQRGQNGKSVQVGVTLKAKSWMRVVVDGRLEFEGVLPEGTQRTWAADEKVSVLAGNAGGVMVEFNNKSAQPMGAPGVPQEVTFAANHKSRS
ncbi:MAG TPA: RodZ domain-containing protein [Candidatus Sericytochromatia bacterium]